MMNWILKHLPEIVGMVIFTMGMFTITYKAMASNFVNISYIDAVVYGFVAIGTAGVLKAVQIISEAIFKKQ